MIGALAKRLVETHMVNHETQIRAWSQQIDCLCNALTRFPGWHVLLEYPLVRLSRRIDAVLLSDRAIFVLEFKSDNAIRDPDREQAEDYALDLRDFHAQSSDYPIIPVLVAPSAPIGPFAPPLILHAVTSVIDANAAALADRLDAIAARLPQPIRPLAASEWERAAYRPVPTIVEAATMLYRKHGVEEIAQARADIGNLTSTTTAIREAITEAASTGQYLVLFVTGIPGAGKTLCGLNAVFGADYDSALLTGNLPLVHVLREALAQDAKRAGQSLRAARHKLDSAIQPLLGFLRDNTQRTEAPHEHVIVFDEAQRAWDAAFGLRKFGLADSEAALFLDIMHRHRDWAVIVALVGNGQEINTGEAGLESWGAALAARPEWRIAGPAGIIGGADPARRLFTTIPDRMVIDPVLHLDVSVRQIRSEAASAWIDAVLEGDATTASKIAEQADGIPFSITRSLTTAKLALRRLARGSRRAGLVCGADAKRLRADGLSADFPHMDPDVVANWFLRRWPDVRGSDALELPATQFACQGLELDLVGLCWGGDLIRRPGQSRWQARKFRGTSWQDVRNPDSVTWRINTYRVLLTRARYETVIFIPAGDADDATRAAADFDAIAAFLRRCGAAELAADEETRTAKVLGDEPQQILWESATA